MSNITEIIEELDRKIAAARESCEWTNWTCYPYLALRDAYPMLRAAALDAVRQSSVIEGWMDRYDAQSCALLKLEEENERLRAQVAELSRLNAQMVEKLKG